MCSSIHRKAAASRTACDCQLRPTDPITAAVPCCYDLYLSHGPPGAITTSLWFAFVEVSFILAGRNFMAEYMQDWNPTEVRTQALAAAKAATAAAAEAAEAAASPATQHWWRQQRQQQQHTTACWQLPIAAIIFAYSYACSSWALTSAFYLCHVLVVVLVVCVCHQHHPSPFSLCLSCVFCAVLCRCGALPS